jgi:serine/threonine protein kinase
MEKINGGTLESFIKKHRTEKSLSSKKIAEAANSSNDSSPTIKIRDKVLSEEVAASITKDIINGLSHIHIKNFIHRDMKPENILIDEKFYDDGTQPENP